jgi:hypothetical protein
MTQKVSLNETLSFDLSSLFLQLTLHFLDVLRFASQVSLKHIDLVHQSLL